MSDKTIFVMIRNLPKKENVNMGIDHALGSMTVIDYETEPVVALVGKAVLNTIKGQRMTEVCGIESSEEKIQFLLMSYVKVMVCKEDMDKYGITEDMFTDASEFGEEEKLVAATWDEIESEMKKCDDIMWF